MAEGKLGIKDIMDFVKAGWKPADVKEIMELSKAPEEPPTPAPEDGVKNVVQKEPDVEPPVADDEPDYKMMVGDLQKQVEDLQSKLDSAQKANINADVSKTQTKVSTSDAINNMFRDVIS